MPSIRGGRYVILHQRKGICGHSQLSRATTSYIALNQMNQVRNMNYSKNEVDTYIGKACLNQAALKKLNASGFGIIGCCK